MFYVGVREAQHTVQHIKIHFIFLSHICDLLPQIQAFPLSVTKLKIELVLGFFKNSVSSYLKCNHSIKEQKRKPSGESK